MFEHNLTDNVSDSVERCLGLIRRLAPRMMVRGGGGLSRPGVRRGQPGRKVPAGARRRVVELRCAGKRVREIAAKVGISAPSVRKYLRTAGLEAVDGRRDAVTRSQVVAMRYRVARGDALVAIARDLGVAATTVKRWTRGTKAAAPV